MNVREILAAISRLNADERAELLRELRPLLDTVALDGESTKSDGRVERSVPAMVKGKQLGARGRHGKLITWAEGYHARKPDATDAEIAKHAKIALNSTNKEATIRKIIGKEKSWK